MHKTFENDIFRGELVRLTAEDPKVMAEHFSRWSGDALYLRLMDSFPARPFSIKATQEWIEKEQSKDRPDQFYFMIRSLKDERLLGDIGLDGIQWNHGDTFMGIGLGNREDWGRGYGSDALRLILRYAFNELNLFRVSLNVFEYNTRAIRAYEKVGFVHEGRMRRSLNREGRRWDVLYMGITLDEWAMLDS
jgi:RimJ/RimL family protein N-acetyltransferase